MYDCSDHFSPETDYENFTKLQYGYQAIPKLNKEKAVPSKKLVPTPGQLEKDSKGQPRSYVHKPSSNKPTILDLVISLLHGLSSEVFLH